ncbi:MAG: hypothetical protein LBT88_03745 [Oscillospiraceae bacterium]|jgi:hypothetical protein|nr:hypothetical protein [Oscillospiraceae bacterium]
MKNKTSPENPLMTSLREAAVRLWSLKPNKHLSADCFLSFIFEDGGEFFVSFAENPKSIHVLPGAEALYSYINFLHRPADDGVQTRLRSIALLTDPKGKPLFTSFDPGYPPWTLSDYEVRTSLKVYTEAANLLERYLSFNPDCRFDKLETPTRRFDKDSGTWVNEIRKLKLPEPLTINIEPPDEITLHRISRTPMVNANLELDIFMIMRATSEEGYDKPFYPVMILLCDGDKQVALSTELLSPGYDIVSAVQDTVISFIFKHGKPLSLSVQLPDLMGMLGGFCDDIDVPLIRASFLPAVNLYKSEHKIKD